MGLKKGMSNFKNKQEKVFLENTNKIEGVLKEIDLIDKVSLSKVVKIVSEKTGLHITTIKKNCAYLKQCEKKYLNLIKGSSIIENNDPSLREELRLSKLENANLRNQIKALSNALKNQDIVDTDTKGEDNIDYKKVTEALLEHFKEQIKVDDGKIIDLYSGIREKVIIDMKGK